MQGVHQLSSPALIPTTLGQENQEYIARAFTGSDLGGPSKVVAVVIAPDAETTTALEAGLKSIESLTLDYIAPPSDVTEEEKTVLQSWSKARRASYFTEKCILPKATVPDDVGIINFDEDTLKAGATSFTAGQYASRLAGILAGIPIGMSATYAALPELTEVTERSGAEQLAAVNNGKLILMHDGQKAKIVRGVNSLTTIPQDGKMDWAKIKIVEGMDLITYYLRTTIQDSYIGQYPNTYDNKCILVTAVTTYFSYLERVGVLSAGESWCEIDVAAQEKWIKAQGVETADMTNQQIRAYQTGSWVFLKCGGRLMDAMEDFQLLFNNL